MSKRRRSGLICDVGEDGARVEFKRLTSRPVASANQRVAHRAVRMQDTEEGDWVGAEGRNKTPMEHVDW